MKYSQKTLPNGLRVLTTPMPSLASVTVTLWVKTGSRNEEKRTNGLSHFLEHIVFKGSKKRPSAKEIWEVTDAIGAEMNAGTTKEWTNFYIKVANTHLEEACDVLSDLVLNPLLKPEDIEREKGVIVEEIRMYEDTPLMKVGDIFERVIYTGNPLAWDTSGNSASVRAVTKSDFVRYRETYYYAENMLLSVAGGIKGKEVVKLAQKYFGKLRSQKPKIKITKFSSRQKSPQVLLKSKKNEQAHFILGFLGEPRGHKDRFTEAVLASILGGGASSRLFIEIRERRGLAYSVKTSGDHYADTGTFASYAGVDVDRVDEAIKVMLAQYFGLASGKLPISAKELAKAKEYLKGHIALGLEDTKAVNELFGENELFLGRVETPEEIFKGIEKVRAADVVALAKKIFRPEKLNLAIIGPYKDAKRFEKLLK